MIIILDTNFLISVVKHRIADKIKEFGGKIVVPETVEKELSKPLGKEASKNASVAIEMIHKWKASIYPAKSKDVDKSVLETAKELKGSGDEVYVATMDEKLQGELKKEGLGIISIKRGKILSKSK